VRRVAVVIAIAAAAFVAVDVPGEAIAAAGPYPLRGGVLTEHTCKKSQLLGLRCISEWYRFSTARHGRRSVATVHYRWVYEFARPAPVNVRRTLTGEVRKWWAAEARKPSLRVAQPLQMRWADGWRVLVADITMASRG